MTLERDIEDAVSAAKKVLLNTLDLREERAGSRNPYGDESLVLDLMAEREIIEILGSSDNEFAVLTEEGGLMRLGSRPEYLAIVDPIDGSTNLSRGIPLCSVGIAVAPYQAGLTDSAIVLSRIESVFTDDIFEALSGRGVTRNGEPVHVARPKPIGESIVSYDTKCRWDDSFASASAAVLSSVRDMRRTGSNLLDLCLTAAGALDAMIDLRNILPIVHVSGTHMVREAGGVVLDERCNNMILPLELPQRMSFVAASSVELATAILGEFHRGQKLRHRL
ncbi:MAG: inositol monophosphatase family protein [Candidatus Thorarchaeota archaeon]